MQKLKILAIFGFIFLTISLVLLHNSPAQGYEISIYSATPIAAWVFLIINICLGLFIVVHQAFNTEKGNFWLVGFLLVIFSIFIFLIIPQLRGYYSYDDGDPLIHISIANSIIKTGHFSENFYPITHVLIAIISLICDIPTIWNLGYLMPFISLLFICFSYLLARATQLKNGQALLVAASSTVLFYSSLHISLYPNAIALLLVPLVFYFYFRGLENPTISDRLLLILLLLFYPFIYAPVALVITLCLVAAELIKWIIRRRTPRFHAQEMSVSANPALISFIMLFLWSSSFLVFDYTIGTAFSWLRGESIRIPQLEATQELIFPLGLGEMVKMGLKMYGKNLVFMGLSLLTGIIIIRRAKNRDEEIGMPILAFGLFVVSGISAIVLFFTTLAVAVGRLLTLNYAMWITPLLTGFILYEIFHKRLRLGTTLVTCLLAILSISSILGLYRSPYINQPSTQITRMAAASGGWVIQRAVPFYTVTVMGYYFDAVIGIIGYESKDPRGVSEFWIYHVADPDNGIPEHFGYQDHQKISDALSTESKRDERYMIVTGGFRNVSTLLNQPDNTMYSNQILGHVGFQESDFAKLELDPSVDKLYSNGDTDIWYIEKTIE